MTTLCHIDELREGTGLGFEVDGARVFAVKWHGRIYLYRNRCPHQGTPLDWNPNTFFDCEGEHLQCSTHGALFEADSGRCIAGPCLGARLQAWPYRLEDQRIVAARAVGDGRRPPLKGR